MPDRVPVQDLRLRLVSGAGLAGVVILALFMSGKLARDSQARVAELRGDARSAEEVRAEAARQRLDRQFDPTAYAARIEEDASVFGLDGVSILELGAAQKYQELIEEPVVLAPGQSFSSDHVAIRASHEKVRYQQHGATVSARHSVVTVTNVSGRPIAYFLRVRSVERGHCEVRGARMHNAMALRPRETAEIVVCAGGGKVELQRLDVLEITDLGYIYLSKVPPVTVGHDGTTDTAHRPLERVQMCRSTVDTKGIAGMLGNGTVRWVDVADFYSRHDCEQFRFFPEYRHTGADLARLPAVPP